MTLSHRDVLALEEMNFNAWPSLTNLHYDGWLLRSSGGASRRVNSVNPIARGSRPLDERIAAAETIYARWGRHAIFRITPLADPGLDDALAARGYQLNGATYVQTAALDARPVSSDVDFFAEASDAWIEGALLIRDLEGEEAGVFAAQHRAIGVETAWGMIRNGGQPVAVGVVAVERGWAGLHGIYVAKGARRGGLGLALSEALLAHASAKGARKAWLQVEQANLAAQALYRRLGFVTAYSYVHRVLPG